MHRDNIKNMKSEYELDIKVEILGVDDRGLDCAIASCERMFIFAVESKTRADLIALLTQTLSREVQWALIKTEEKRSKKSDIIKID